MSSAIKDITFEYAVIRVVPRVEREEFINAGVILYAKQQNFIKCLINLDQARCKCLFESADVDEIKLHLESFRGIAMGTNLDHPVASYDFGERFRWLTAARSTIIQSGPVHPGKSDNPEGVIQRLFQDLVLGD